MGIKGARLVPRAEAIPARAPLVHGEIAPFRDYTAKHLRATTLATIHQRLRAEHGLAMSVSSLRRCVRAEFAEESAAEQATVLREDPPPGQEAQLGYGQLARPRERRPALGAGLHHWHEAAGAAITRTPRRRHTAVVSSPGRGLILSRSRAPVVRPYYNPCRSAPRASRGL